MKIAFVHHNLEVGHGTNTLVWQYAEGLGKKDHVVDIYTLVGEDHHLGADSLFDVRVTKLPFGNGRLNTSIFAPLYKPFWQVREELESYDVVISMIYPSCLLPVWPEKLKHPKVIHIEWSTPDGVWSNLGERLYSKLAIAMQGITCIRADEVLVPGDFVKKWVLDYYGIDAKQMYLDGIDFHQFDISKVTNRYNTKNILYVGRVVPYKNLEDLINAVALIKDATLTIVGNNTAFPSYTKKLYKLCHKLGLESGRVRFAGVVPDAELTSYYAACQVYCSPSRWEGFLKSFAYAYAKPMVSYDLTSARDIIQDGITGKVVKNPDPAELAYELSELLNQPNYCKSLGENGYQWAKENLDIDKIVDNLEALIKC